MISQYSLPHHALSRLIGKMAKCRIRWLKNLLIKIFVWRYRVDLSEVLEEEPQNYESFNDFFTRALKPEARTIATEPDAIICPIDGAISQIGKIERDKLIQAKGCYFDLATLLGNKLEKYFETFQDGNFATLYLSPRDYHRVHMPIDGKLQAMSHIPGKLFSVNPAAVRAIPKLFARNERVITIFNTTLGPMAMILVGAMLVASIETTWAGIITPPRGKTIRHWNYEDNNIALNRGQEMGRFQFGSTVILLFPKDNMNWSSPLAVSNPIKMGQLLGRLKLNDSS